MHVLIQPFDKEKLSLTWIVFRFIRLCIICDYWKRLHGCIIWEIVTDVSLCVRKNDKVWVWLLQLWCKIYRNRMLVLMHYFNKRLPWYVLSYMHYWELRILNVQSISKLLTMKTMSRFQLHWCVSYMYVDTCV